MIGWVRHRRFKPRPHNLKYPVFMWYLDLDEIDAVTQQSRLFSNRKFGWVRFQQDDYFGRGKQPIKQAVIEKIAQSSHIPAARIHRVAMLTNLRMLNFIMNPVTFYYAFDENDDLLAIMPEITNTPWNERHSYVLPLAQSLTQEKPAKPTQKNYRFQPQKQFHISPFHDMDMQYDWRLGNPVHKNVHFHLENWQNREKIFDATMALTPEPITAGSVRQTLIRFPWMTVKVASGIYWHALKLWLKGVPFYSHPSKRNKEKTI